LEYNVQPDHLHLVVEVPPKYAVRAVMGFLKGKLAVKVLEHYPHLGRKFWGRHLWARGYCVSTVGLDEEMIRQYVRWQEKQEREEEQKQEQQGNLFE
jgi:putative transposase